MITNLVAVISFEVVTNWVSVSRTSQIIPASAMFQAVYRPVMVHQTGYAQTNHMALVEYNGKKVKVLLEEGEPVACCQRDLPEDQTVNTDLPKLRLIQ